MRRISIIQGENYVSGDPDVVISTVLGSCVAVCLQDPDRHIGGMNHFLLGEPREGEDIRPSDMQRYGLHAMELLINALMQKGAVRSRLRAHLYGGADINAGLGSIGSSNAAFALRFIETEGIALGHCDLGGSHARRVEFLPYQGKARSLADRQPPTVPTPPVATPASEGDVELFPPRKTRIQASLLVARLSTSSRKGVARVQNISTGGMQIETSAPVEIGQRIQVELPDGLTVGSEVMWARRGEAGVRFDVPVSTEKVRALAKPRTRASRPQTARLPRLSAQCPVSLKRDGRIVSAFLTDISQGGAQIRCTNISSVGDQVVLSIPGLAVRQATIRWAGDGGIGLSFAEKLGLADLAQWLASPDHLAAQRSAHSGAQASERSRPIRQSR